MRVIFLECRFVWSSIRGSPANTTLSPSWPRPPMCSWELFAEVTALVNALEEHGHAVEEDNHHKDAISHPIVTSRFHTFALRRTPPTKITP